MKARIALLGAMGEETHLLQTAIDVREVRQVAGREFYLGYLQGVPVVTGFSKWGKVAATISTTLAIQLFDVEEVLFLGVAGSFDPRVKRGDVVLATHCLQYDMDVSALPDYEKWEVPLIKIKRFVANELNNQLLHPLAKSYLDRHPLHLRGGLTHQLSVHQGLLGTGDSFVADSVKKNLLKGDLPDMLAVDMESAAVAQVCHEFQRPFNVVRVISDDADDSAVFDFQQFITDQAAPAVKYIAEEYVRGKFPRGSNRSR